MPINCLIPAYMIHKHSRIPGQSAGGGDPCRQISLSFEWERFMPGVTKRRRPKQRSLMPASFQPPSPNIISLWLPPLHLTMTIYEAGFLSIYPANSHSYLASNYLNLLRTTKNYNLLSSLIFSPYLKKNWSTFASFCGMVGRLSLTIFSI